MRQRCHVAVNCSFALHLVLLVICKPCIRFRWSLYQFQPKSSHLSSGVLGYPRWGHFHHLLLRLEIILMHTHIILAPRDMTCIMLFVHCTVFDIVSCCVLVLSRAGSLDRERGSYRGWVRGAVLRSHRRLDRQDDLTHISLLSLHIARSLAL